jgi:hypothetical protein
MDVRPLSANIDCGLSWKRTPEKPPSEEDIRRAEPREDRSEEGPPDGYILRALPGGKDVSRKKPLDRPPDTFALSAARLSRETGSSLALIAVEKSLRVHKERSSCSPKRAVSAPVSAIHFVSLDSVSVSSRQAQVGWLIAESRCVIRSLRCCSLRIRPQRNHTLAGHLEPPPPPRRASRGGHQSKSRGSPGTLASRPGGTMEGARRLGVNQGR